MKNDSLVQTPYCRKTSYNTLTGNTGGNELAATKIQIFCTPDNNFYNIRCSDFPHRDLEEQKKTPFQNAPKYIASSKTGFCTTQELIGINLKLFTITN